MSLTNGRGLLVLPFKTSVLLECRVLCRAVGRVLINSVYLGKSYNGELPSCWKGIFLSFQKEKSIFSDRLGCHCKTLALRLDKVTEFIPLSMCNKFTFNDSC